MVEHRPISTKDQKIWTRQNSMTQRREVLMPKKGEEFVFLFEDGSVKLAGRDQVLRTSTSTQEHQAESDLHGQFAGIWQCL